LNQNFTKIIKYKKLKDVGLFADGAAVKFVGEEPFRICKKYVDHMVTVTNDEICAAIKGFVKKNFSFFQKNSYFTH